MMQNFQLFVRMGRRLTGQVFPLITAVIVASAALAQPKPELTPGQSPAPSATAAPITIVTTTTFLGDLVKTLVGSSASVTALMGPGVDPHLYSVTTGDMRKLTSASIVVYHGLHLEGRMSEVLAKLGIRTTAIAAGEMAASERIRRPDGAVPDPHIWFDVGLWSTVASRLAHRLSEEFNKRGLDGASILRRGSQYETELLALDGEVRAALQAIPAERRIMITAHDAFGYFGDQYQVSVRGIQGVSTDSEAGLQRVNELIDTFIDFKIPAIFAETSVSDRAVRAIVDGAKARGHTVKIAGPLYSDALGMPGSGAETYVGMVRANLKVITSAMMIPVVKEKSAAPVGKSK